MGCIGSWWGNRREGDRWGDLGVDGWVILGWISRRWDVGMWIFLLTQNPTDTKALGSTQPLTRNEYQEYFLGVKATGA